MLRVRLRVMLRVRLRVRLRITESSHHTDLRGRRAGAGGARGLQPCLSQTPPAVPEVDLEAGDGGLAAEMNILTNLKMGKKICY